MKLFFGALPRLPARRTSVSVSSFEWASFECMRSLSDWDYSSQTCWSGNPWWSRPCQNSSWPVTVTLC